MKKTILLLLFVAFGFAMQAQDRVADQRENILLYSDTTVLNGGDTLTRLLYGFLPTDLGDSNYLYEYLKLYKLNSLVVKDEVLKYYATPDDSVLLLGSYRTFDWVYPQVLTIDEQNWHLASWQTFLQKIINN